jgi:hypothetical protein
MSFRYFMAGAIVAFAALPGPAAAQAQAYPWCTEGNAIHCYYMNLQQCEETVDFHGFCIRNPAYQGQSDRAPAHPPQ